MTEQAQVCEICGDAPVREVLINKAPLWYTYVPLCKRHARSRRGWRCLVTDGNRRWVRWVQQQDA